MISAQGKSRKILFQQIVDSAGGVYEGPDSPPRLDLPVSLETRGTTQQVSQADRDQFPEWQQALLWSKQTIHKNTTAAKLREAGELERAARLEWCHSIYTVAQCTKCHTVQKFPNRCDLFFCAECQPRISSDRKKAVEWWTREISQPKHVVLTVRNVPDLTKFHVQEFRKWFTNLRRSKFARNWVGGFYCLEVTNEGRGWHLHLHALINAGWIDQSQLSERWNHYTNGLGRIVHVRDARRLDYLNEVTKYAVKGSQLAAWRPDQIVTFINAFDGVRTFGVFGDLYGKRTQFSEWFRSVRNLKMKCKCGCDSMHFMTELEFYEKDFQPATNDSTIPPPKIEHPEFSILLDTRPQCGPR